MAAETTPASEAPAEKREIPTLTYAGPTMPEAVAELEQKKEQYRGMGGADKVARQHSLGKLTVRERVERLFAVAVWRTMKRKPKATPRAATPAST